MKTFKLFISAALVLSLTGCSSEEEIVYEPVAATVTAGINGGLTRAYDNSWEAGDAIGISSENYTNVQYAYTSESKFEHAAGFESGIFFKDNTKHNFTAYYPFNGTEGTSAGTISASTSDQSKQKTFDFLFAPKVEGSREKSEITFDFSHKMTRLILQVKVDTSTGINAEAAAAATFDLSGFKHNGTFNTAKGTTEVSGEDASNWALANSTDEGGKKNYKMILFPQTATLTFRAVVGEENFTCTLTPALEAGVSYTYDITVKKTGLVVSECTISNWTAVNGGSVNAFM